LVEEVILFISKLYDRLLKNFNNNFDSLSSSVSALRSDAWRRFGLAAAKPLSEGLCRPQARKGLAARTDRVAHGLARRTAEFKDRKATDHFGNRVREGREVHT
jgi:hypothetical protein